MPQPAPVSPVSQTSIAVSGGTGNTTVSGLSPASGLPPGSTTGSFSGPHYVEKQSLRIDYFRVPKYSFNTVSPTDFSLSGSVPKNTTVSGQTQSTEVYCKVTASVEATKSYDRFSTSSYQQPQRFEIMAMSADANGNTYGAVTTGGLGPQGSIRTSQPYYNRRPWNSNDETFIYTTQAYSYRFTPSADPNDNNTFIPMYGRAGGHYQGESLASMFGRFPAIALYERYPELLTTNYPLSINNTVWTGRLWGPYLGSNDQARDAIDLIDEMARGVTWGRLFSDTLAKTGNYGEAEGRISEFDTSAGGYIREYDADRHSYS